MRSFVLILLLGGAALLGQVPDKPETWTTLEGTFIRNVMIEDPGLLSIAARAASLKYRDRVSIPPEIGPLFAMTDRAVASRNGNLVWRAMTRLLFALNGERLGEVHEIASSVNFFTDRTVIAPGDPLHARLEPLFNLGRPLKEICHANISIETADGKPVVSRPPLPITALEDAELTLPTQALKPGRYLVRYVLLDPAGKELARVARMLIVDAAFKPRVARLQAQLDQVGAKGLVAKGPSYAVAVETATALVDLMKRSSGEYVSALGLRIHPATQRLAGDTLLPLSAEAFSIERDLPLAEKLVAGLLDGKDPLAELKGDLHLALRAGSSSEARLCRVYIPSRYVPGTPALIALHGEGADEGYFFDRVGDSSLATKLAEERGYIIVAPAGSGAFNAFEGPGASEPLEILKRLQAVYSIDDKRVLLMGYSSGAIAAWSLAAKPGATFAGLAAIAGAPLPSVAPFQSLVNLPVLLVQGVKDSLRSITEARMLPLAASRQMKAFRYIEKPEDDHYSITASTLPAIFDFFDTVKAPAPAK
jgi:predicted esterase